MSIPMNDPSPGETLVAEALVKVMESQTRANDAVSHALQSLSLQQDKYDARLEQIDRDLRFLDAALRATRASLDIIVGDALGSRSVDAYPGREDRSGR